MTSRPSAASRTAPPAIQAGSRSDSARRAIATGARRAEAIGEAAHSNTLGTRAEIPQVIS